MSEEKVRKIHRLCPCAACDVEGIQSWLEDMAAEGLLLTEDDVFCGVFTFERTTPQRMIYRLDVAQKKKSGFFIDTNELTEEEKEAYRSMGWQYILKYGDFRIFRTAQQNAPELNADSQVHAASMGILKKNQRATLIALLIMTAVWFLVAGSTLRFPLRNAVMLGAVFILSVYGELLYAILKHLIGLFRLKKYEKRLLAEDSLTCRRDWKKSAPVSYCIRALPVLLCCGIAFGLISTFIRAGEEIPIEEYHEKLPFATVADTFPDGVITDDNILSNYRSVTIWENSVASNIEWEERCNISTADEEYFCLLFVDYHETATEWMARLLEKEYYFYDATRYHHKHFTDFDAPELGVDSVRVYESYASLYVLMREGNRVVHAVVYLNDEADHQNQWLLWAKAMAEMLK